MQRVMLEVRRALTRFRYVSPVTTLRLTARYLRLHAYGRPATSPAEGRRERIVVTLTSIPQRVRMLAPTLRSLLEQSESANRIIVALPEKARRDGSTYPHAEQLHLPPGVERLTCEDEGPATKLLPALIAEPDALLVVVDDDVIYPPDFLRTLLKAHRRNPRAAVGYRGVCLAEGVAFGELSHVFATNVKIDERVDVLFGTWGYLLPPGALDRAVHDFSGTPEALRMVDDVWISGHLARRGIARLITPAHELPIETLSSFRSALCRGPNRSGANDQEAISWFGHAWRRAEADNEGENA